MVWRHLIHQEMPISRNTTSPQSEWTRFLTGTEIYLVSTTLIWICILEPFYILIILWTILMNLFQDLRRNYGQGTVKTLRACENIEKKTSSFRNHRVFTLRCRDQGLIPPSLRLKCPINTQKARDIVHKAEKELLRERIRVINNKIERLDLQKSKWCSTGNGDHGGITSIILNFLWEQK